MAAAPLDREGPIPPYRQIANALRERIESGEIPPGRRVPSLTELEQEYDVARDTLRKAIQVLKDEGWVETVIGMGVYVVDPKPRPPAEQPSPRPDLRLASDRMKAAGIVQQGDPILAAVARPFDLPAEAGDARRLVDELLAAMQRVREYHVFGKGMGLAAPQIGVGRAAAVVQPPGDDASPIILLNPQVISESHDSDEQYEGCLSFFDVRGLVPRPLRMEVEHTTLEGRQIITVFSDGLARLVAHEIDHLYGRLYLDRMREGVEPISVQEYKGTGQAWDYGERS